jgi:hypothetical protein
MIKNICCSTPVLKLIDHESPEPIWVIQSLGLERYMGRDQNGRLVGLLVSCPRSSQKLKGTTGPLSMRQ